MKHWFGLFLFLFSGSVLAELTDAFFQELAKAGANITVDAETMGNPQRIGFILNAWVNSTGKVTIKHFRSMNNPGPLVDYARKVGGRLTIEE